MSSDWYRLAGSWEGSLPDFGVTAMSELRSNQSNVTAATVPQHLHFSTLPLLLLLLLLVVVVVVLLLLPPPPPPPRGDRAATADAARASKRERSTWREESTGTHKTIDAPRFKQVGNKNTTL
jgi:flagellar biosynthesis/type III secretory pathway M-ring protein FliF/YscJ